MLKHSYTFMLVVALVFSILTGCSQSSEPQEKIEKSAEVNGKKDPVKLVFYQESASITDDEFNKLIVEPVKKKLPHITVELLRAGKGQQIQDLVASGSFPDLIYTGSRNADRYTALDIPADLNEFIKKSNIDLNQYEPATISAIQKLSPKGEMFSLPFSINFGALYYNKDIFDRFGVAYPKDQMTWDDAIELGRKIARVDGGVQYLALNTGFFRNFSSPLALDYVNPKTNKANVNSDPWKKAVLLYQAITEIPGNKISVDNGRNRFMDDRNLAMLPDHGEVVNLLQEKFDKGQSLNWDMATYPSFKEQPKVTTDVIAQLLMMSSSSKHKEEAFEVIKVVNAKDLQAEMTKNGRLTSYKDVELKNNFGANLSALKGKNVQGLFKGDRAKSAPYSEFERLAITPLNKAVLNVVEGKADVNTALREAEMEINKAIEAESKNK